MTQNKKRAAREGTPPKSIRPDDSRMAYSMREVADALGVSERSVWTLCNTGKIRSIKLGRLVRIPSDAVAELLGGTP